MPSERYERRPRGCWKDVVFVRNPDGSERIEHEYQDWRSNLIVIHTPTVIAAALAGYSPWSGISFSAQGSGDVAWDTSTASPAYDATALQAEFFRMPVSAIDFRDDSDVHSDTPTNNLMIKTILGYADANGPGGTGAYIREQGLFGGSATATAGSGQMMNWIIHPAIWKDNQKKIVRYIRWTF